MDGWLESDEVGTIYYAPARVGFFAAYNATGDRKYSRSTVEPRPLPQVKLIRDGRVGIDPETPWATLALEVQGSKVQLLRFLAGEHSSRPVGILDIYDSATGEYEVSMALPDRTYEIEVAGDSVYALTKEGLVRWSPESEEML